MSDFEQESGARRKKLTPPDALAKIQHYCAYQERSHQEVRNKLYAYGLFSSDVDEILSRLITDGFLNEERFAKAFAGGKFRVKKWGRLKIIRELEARDLTKNCIKVGLKEIDEVEYRQSLQEILAKKSSQIQEGSQFLKRDKLAKYGISKGYEPDLVWSIIREFY